MKTIITEVLIVLLCTGFAKAGPIPAYIDFDGDTSGLPPATGGIGQLSDYYGPEGAVLVQSSAYGISTQPLVVHSESYYAGAAYTFDPVNDGILRVEVTVAFDSLIGSYFLQTARTQTGTVVTRLNSRNDGTIWAYDWEMDKTIDLGTYIPNQPFRLRMDLDLSEQTWSASFDDEMNGFADDPINSGLPFSNPHIMPHFVGSLNMDLFTNSVTGNIAYDDISISIVPVPGAILLGSIGLTFAGWKLRKRKEL